MRGFSVINIVFQHGGVCFVVSLIKPTNAIVHELVFVSPCVFSFVCVRGCVLLFLSVNHFLWKIRCKSLLLWVSLIWLISLDLFLNYLSIFKKRNLSYCWYKSLVKDSSRLILRLSVVFSWVIKKTWKLLCDFFLLPWKVSKSQSRGK